MNREIDTSPEVTADDLTFSGRPVHHCGTCKFHDVQDVIMPDGQPVIGKKQMICRRLPPHMIAVQNPTPAGITVSVLPIFPGVNDTIWCWEHKPENGAQDVE